MVKNKKSHIGENIRAIRRMIGWSQAELAERIGKTRGLISIIEKQGKINHYTLQAIANEFDTTISFIENYQIGQAIVTRANSEEPLPGPDKTVDVLLREIDLLKELIEHQKKIIALLEKDNRLLRKG